MYFCSLKFTFLPLLLNLVWSIYGIDFQVKHAFVLFRHGDRSPIRFLKHVKGYRAEDWPVAAGQLTKLGMGQEFELGRYLSVHYDSLISSNYNRYEIWVRSSDYERTLMSAESFLAGLYYKDRQLKQNNEKIHPNLSWLPVPIHTRYQDKDSLLLVTDCPYHKRLATNITLDYDSKMSTTDTTMLINLMQKMHYELNSKLRFANHVQDTLFCGVQHNKSLPSYVTRKIYDRLNYLNDLSYYLHYNTQQTEKMARMMSGTLLSDIINKTRDVLSDKKDILGKNMTIYSAHDTDVSFLLSILGAFNFKQPPYCACVMIELGCDLKHCNDETKQPHDWYVRLYFRNDTTREPYRLPLPKCPGDCNVQDFISSYSSMATTPDERFKLCHEKLSDFIGLNNTVIWLVALLVIACVILLIIIGLCCRKDKKIKEESSYSLLSDYET